MTVYASIDQCKSKLGRDMQQWRAERPSEWLMDEFIYAAEAYAKRIDYLERFTGELENLDPVLYDSIEKSLKEV